MIDHKAYRFFTSLNTGEPIDEFTGESSKEYTSESTGESVKV